MFFHTYSSSKFSFSREVSSLEDIKREIDEKNNNWGILGVPFDSTSSYKSGSRFGPILIREASYSFENFNLDLKKSLNTCFFDFGDIDVVNGNLNETLKKVNETILELLNLGIKPILLGGEHSISLASIEAIANLNEVTIVHLDAHMDLADTLNEEKYSHGTVMRRIHDLNPKNIIQIGIRSSSKEEFDFSNNCSNISYFSSKDVFNNFDAIKSALEAIDNPIYLTIDLDVLDPSFTGAVGNPTPLGINPFHVQEILKTLENKDILGFDLVELAADKIADSSAINATKIIIDFLTLNK